ncbi:MAG: cyclic nucleotide-binding domain-containing protein [Proteobacteria bacterium]|nr:cyclic nucleotide-binding domain-containing protein [Pseudomonadota bacterium]
MKETITDLLVKIPMFAGLDADQLRIIEKHIKLFELAEGEILFKEGDQGDYVCFVVDGRLDVIKKTLPGDIFVLNTLSRGQSVGEMSIIDKRPRSATVLARTQVTLFTLARDDFEVIMKEHAGIGMKVLKGLSLLLSKKLRQTSSRLVSYMVTAG